MRSRTRVVSITAVCWLAACALSLCVYALTDDHFDRISRARQIARYGDLPFRDFFDPGYVAAELASAALQIAFGDNLLGEALLTSASIACGAVVVFFLARRIVRPPAAFATAALVLLFLPRQYDYDKVLFYPLGLLLCWRYVERRRTTDLVLLAAGLVAGAAFRYDTGVYIGATALVTLAIVHAGERQALARRLRQLALSIVLLGLPILAFVQYSGGIMTAADQIIVYAMRESARTRLTSVPRFDVLEPPPRRIVIRWAPAVDEPLRSAAEQRHGLVRGVGRGGPEGRTWDYEINDPATARLRALVNDAAVEDTARLDRSRLLLEEPNWIRAWYSLPSSLRWLPGLLNADNALALVYYALRLQPALTAILLVVGTRRRWWSSSELAMLAGLVTMCTIQNVFLLREPLIARIGGVAGPAAVLSAWLASRAWHTGNGRLRAVARVATIGLVVLAVSCISATANWRGFLRRDIVNPGHLASQLALMSVSPPSLDLLPAGRRAGLVTYLRECTGPHDRVLITWFVPELYFFSQRGFAAGMPVVFGEHWSEPRFQRRSAQLLADQHAPIVVTRTDDRHFTNNYTALARLLDERYRVAGKTAFGDPEAADDAYVVHVRQDLTWDTTDPKTSMPCLR